MDAPAAGFMAHHRGGFAPLGGRGCEGGWVQRESAVPVGPAKRPELGSLSCYLWERRGDERRGEERRGYIVGLEQPPRSRGLSWI